MGETTIKKIGGYIMALITCLECGKEISSAAKSCPHCGCPTEKKRAKKIPTSNFSTKKVFLPIFLAVAILSVLGIGLYHVDKYVLKPGKAYALAQTLFQEMNYDEAIMEFEALNSYKDSETQVLECKYAKATAELDSNRFDTAKNIFIELGDYSNSKEMVYECDYRKAGNLLEDKQYKNAAALFESLEDYSNSKEMVKESYYQFANYLIGDDVTKISLTDRKKVYEYLESLAEYKDSKDILFECKYQYARKWYYKQEYDLAIPALLEIKDYKDCYSLCVKAYENRISSAMNKKLYNNAINLYAEMIDIGVEGATEGRLYVCETQLKYALSKNNYRGVASSYKKLIEYGKEGAEEAFSEYCESLFASALKSAKEKDFGTAKNILLALIDIGVSDAETEYMNVVEAEEKAAMETKKKAEEEAKKKAEETAEVKEALSPLIGIWMRIYSATDTMYIKIDSNGKASYISQFFIDMYAKHGKTASWAPLTDFRYDSSAKVFICSYGLDDYQFIAYEGKMYINCINYADEDYLQGAYTKID